MIKAMTDTIQIFYRYSYHTEIVQKIEWLTLSWQKTQVERHRVYVRFKE